jgi:hypothetical protein
MMHLTKNLCVNLLGFLGLYGKTKDTPEAHEDQQHLKGRDDMHPERFQGSASYALTKEEKEIFFEALFSIKVPSGFSLNIKGIINMAQKKFQNLKSHDSRACDAIAFDCIEGNSTRKCLTTHCEGMRIPQCNFSEGNQSIKSTRVTEGCGPVS